MMRLLHQNGASGGEVQHTQHKLERALGAPLHGNRLEKLVGFERSGDGNTIPGESERHAARGAGEAEGGAQVAAACTPYEGRLHADFCGYQLQHNLLVVVHF